MKRRQNRYREGGSRAGRRRVKRLFVKTSFLCGGARVILQRKRGKLGRNMEYAAMVVNMCFSAELTGGKE